jgi:negative regulator of flagellin synthesis FlgM
MSISQLNGPQRQHATMAVAALRANGYSATPGVSAAGTRQPDSVSISEAARSLAGATRAVANASDVREDRVSAVKSAIADGTYSIDSRALAKSMVRSLGR